MRFGYLQRSSLLGLLIGGALILATANAYKLGYFHRQVEGVRNSSSYSRLKEDSTRVRGVLVSEFNGLFDLDDTLIAPPYVIGDLNGDGIDDLAASVRLNQLIDPNDESLPPFRFEKAMGPGGGIAARPLPKDRLRMGALRAYSDLELSILVVIHGRRDLGFLGTQPEQRFVLVDGWSSGKLRMRLYKGELQITRFGDELELVPPPTLIGNAIILIDRQNTGSAVYWDGSSYRWYDVPEPPN